MTTPAPFTIEISDDVLADLRDRLHRVRWPDQESPGRHSTLIGSVSDRGGVAGVRST